MDVALAGGTRALVTGASGFLGWHVARLLCERGCAVRALVRPESRVADLAVETVAGDLRDAESLQRAVEGCSVVFHVAADYRLWAKDPRELYRSNVDGTRNLLAAARNAGVARVVYTSTVGCIGIPHGGIGDETTPVTLEDMAGDYKRSKFLAEQVALEFALGPDGATLGLADLPPGRTPEMEVKAATYHDLRPRRGAQRLSAMLTLDV